MVCGWGAGICHRGHRVKERTHESDLVLRASRWIALKIIPSPGPSPLQWGWGDSSMSLERISQNSTLMTTLYHVLSRRSPSPKHRGGDQGEGLALKYARGSKVSCPPILMRRGDASLWMGCFEVGVRDRLYRVRRHEIHSQARSVAATHWVALEQPQAPSACSEKAQRDHIGRAFPAQSMLPCTPMRLNNQITPCRDSRKTSFMRKKSFLPLMIIDYHKAIADSRRDRHRRVTPGTMN